jgi:undecaprenyl-diphosphatase
MDRFSALDGACVVALNRILVHRPCRTLARTISRLGDGELWAVLLLALVPLPGSVGLRCALHLGAVAANGLVLYLLNDALAGDCPGGCRSRASSRRAAIPGL